MMDYLENKEELDALAEKVVYTGPIDAYFDYKYGNIWNIVLYVLRQNFWIYRISREMQQSIIRIGETPWTRIIEHKWFEFGKDEQGNDLPKTVISREYSSEWKPGDEPYYPVNDEKNGNLYDKYKELA